MMMKSIPDLRKCCASRVHAIRLSGRAVAVRRLARVPVVLRVRRAHRRQIASPLAQVEIEVGPTEKARRSESVRYRRRKDRALAPWPLVERAKDRPGEGNARNRAPAPLAQAVIRAKDR